MDAPSRLDDPDESWQYRGHRCLLDAREDAASGERTWLGYVRSKLPDGQDSDDVDVQVPGDLVYGVDDGWVGFRTEGDPRSAAELKAAVEGLVNQVVEFEESMDG